MPHPPTPPRYASLFVELTGRATIEESQEHDAGHAISDPETEVGRYISRSTRQTGLEDAIDTPEDS